MTQCGPFGCEFHAQGLTLLTVRYVPDAPIRLLRLAARVGRAAFDVGTGITPAGRHIEEFLTHLWPTKAPKSICVKLLGWRAPFR
jgi:hypothetical protein